MRHLLGMLSAAVAVLGMLGMHLTAQTSWTHLSSSKGDLPAPMGTNDQTACLTGDFNNDQRDDFIVASRGSGAQIEIWLTSATAGQFVRYRVEGKNVQPEAGGAVHDIDGDGDLDFVLGRDLSGNSIYWWENPMPNFSGAWRRRSIKTGGSNKHHDQIFGDFDGDQDIELVSWNQGATSLLLFEIPSDPRSASSWPVTSIATGSSKDEGLAAADIDMDGVLDIVGAGHWWKHTGSGKYTSYPIDPTMNYTRSAVGQLIPGGRPEVVLVQGESNGNGYWYQWDGTTWQRNSIGYLQRSHTLDVVDFDGDGFFDILTGEMWSSSNPQCELSIHYGNGRGTFQKSVIGVGNDIHEGRVADIDGDGDLDIIHKPLRQNAPRIDIWRNDRKRLRLDQWQPHVIDGGLAKNAIYVRGGDLDGDGDEDAVAGDAWYVNPGGSSSGWQKKVIGGVFRNVAAVHDFDFDGDLDLFGTQGSGASSSAEFAWAENNGKGSFTVHTNIQKGTGDFLQGVAVGRFLGSKSLQIALSWHQANQGLQVLTLPADPATQTWSWRRATTTSLDEDVSLGDIDLDGDTDLMLGTVWIESPGAKTHVLGKVSDLPGVGGTPTPDRNRLIDIDRDGDLDVVVSLELGRDVVWFENPLPKLTPTGSWQRRILGNAQGQGFSLDAADFDRDGDIDIVLGEHRGSTVNRVLIFENEVWSHGKATNWNVHVIDSQSVSTIDHHDGTVAIDVDHDGDLDILSVGWTRRKVWWFENLALSKSIVETPVITPSGGSFRAARTVTISTVTSGASIYVTTDGKDPTVNSTPYKGPLTLSANTNLRARAFKGGASSAVQDGSFAWLNGELGYWRFDAGAGPIVFDDSRGQSIGRVRGATWSNSGFIQSALDFDGRDDRVEIPSMDVAGSAMSMSAWIFPNAFSHLPSRDARILSKAVGTTNQLHYWMLSTMRVGNDTRLRFRLKTNGNTSTLVANSGRLSLNQWSHVGATYDGAKMALYLNGSEVGRMSKVGPIDTNRFANLWIGDQPPNGTRPFDGLIDEVRIFGRALSSLEMQALSQNRRLDGCRSYGRATSFCGENLRMLTTRAPLTRDPHFGIAASELPANSPGLLLVGVSQGIGLPYLGVNIWIDPSRTFLAAFIQSDVSGRFFMPASLLNVPAGNKFYLQSLWLNTTGSRCPVPRYLTLSATDGIEVLVR